MRPLEFVQKLQTHYSKRHANEAAEKIWLDDMMKTLQNTDKVVLDEAYEMIVQEHTERAFPLPAQLRKFISRAADIVHPESKNLGGTKFHYQGPSKRAPDTKEEIERCRLANEWQHEMMRIYGNWAAYYRAHKHLETPRFGKSDIKPRAPEKEPEPLPIANRDYFAAKAKWKAGTLAEEITRRITGERE